MAAPTTPTLTDVWHTRAEIPMPNTTTMALAQSSWLYCLKAALLNELSGGSTGGSARNGGSVWTVEGSSDGATAGMDGTDRTGSTFNSAKWVQNSEGSAHTWVVLKSPSGFLGAGRFLYICINYTGSVGSANITVSTSAYTGGSVNNRPTSVYETMLGTTSTSSSVSQMGVESTFGVPYRFGFSVNATGEIHCWVNRVGAGIFVGHLQLCSLRFGSAGDQWPVFANCHFLSTSRGATSIITGGTSTSAAIRNPNNDLRSSGGGAVSSFLFGGAAFEGSFGPDGLASQFLAFPWFVVTGDGTTQTWRGVVPDTYVVGNPPVGSSYPSSAAQTQMVVGQLLIPCSVVCTL